jgi:RIO kinase 1
LLDAVSSPDWLITDPEPYVEYDLGRLTTGKEADVFLVERVAGDRHCLLAHKRYRPRRVTHKGELEALGFQGASTFVGDAVYREGRRFAKSRDQRAVQRGSAYGRKLAAASWAGNELDALTRLSRAGVNVPYPVALTDDGLLMQYVGDRARAAPRLAQARLTPDDMRDAAAQLVADLHRMVSCGFVHGDLSAFNLLWWHRRVWIIDLPQAVDLAQNPMAIDLLHRDVANVVQWFTRRGAPFDADQLLADLLSSAYPG